MIIRIINVLCSIVKYNLLPTILILSNIKFNNINQPVQNNKREIDSN